MEFFLALFETAYLPDFTIYLLYLNILDVVTGFIRAVTNKDVSSKKMKRGAISKLMIWIVVFISVLVSNYLDTDLASYVIGYYIVMEIISIFENAGEYIPIPERLKSVLENTEKTNTQDKTKKDTNVDAEILEYINRIDKKEENKNE